MPDEYIRQANTIILASNTKVKGLLAGNAIPNSAVKKSFADGSGCLASARVGCRQFLIESRNA
ncbi:MAG TPA: hypothetical protein VK615_11745 [Candidatus Binatia bacterium]|nr:hypothetical protein [Candidatus Binatia bacterium]